MEITHFDIFLLAVKDCSDRRGILGGDALILPPTEDYGYESTPRNALTFAEMQVDGVHYAVLKLGGTVRNDSPVIQVSPMDSDKPYCVLGNSFLNYLSQGCGVSDQTMEGILREQQEGKQTLVPFLKAHFDPSRLFDEVRLSNLDRYIGLIEHKI